MDRRALTRRLFLLLIASTSVHACTKTEASRTEAEAQRIGQTQLSMERAEAVPFFDYGTLESAACRLPSVMVTSVQDGLEQLPCRQMKAVQHWLNAMMDERRWAGDPDIVIPATPDEDHQRRQLFFGEYWSTLESQIASEEDRIARFEKVVPEAFARMTAVLIASENPIDVQDVASEDDEWIWELPPLYASIPLAQRSQAMRDDVNAWIQNAGIWIYADAGTPVSKAGGDVGGDIDFMLVNLVGFMHRFRLYDDFLTDASITALITKGRPERGMVELWPADPNWANTKVPFSGQGFARELNYKHSGSSLPETENHVLMTLAHYHLMNQWISNNERGTPDDPGNGQVDDASAFWSNDSTLSDKLRDVIARTLHQGVFEDNAHPYQHYTYNALLTLATYSDNPTIRTEAYNAVTFLTTKFTFQSLDGRRYVPMRRQCNKADELSMYSGDAMALAVGVLSGAYKWNDSPYGYRRTFSEFGDCLADNDVTDCLHWPTYTWKIDQGPPPVGDPKAPDNSTAQNISFDAQELSNDFPDTGSGSAIGLNAAFSGYVIPRAVHDFLIRKHGGYYARMMSQYDRDHYDFGALGGADEFPLYFDGDTAIDGPLHNERTPEFYFSGDGFMNVAGGAYNPLYETITAGEGKSYNIPANPFPPLASSCGRDLDYLDREQYDFLSKPYTVLTEVPTGPGLFGGRPYYAPFNLRTSLEETKAHLPFMMGFSDNWWKSTNVATYKNFSYGYKTQLNALGFLAEWEIGDPIDLCTFVPASYRKMDMTFPQELPPDWNDDRLVPMTPFAIEAAAFEVRDLCEYNPNRGQTGFYLVTARVRKQSGLSWSLKVSRGFWEVVPCDQFDSIDEVVATVQSRNPKSHFPFGTIGNRKHFSYKTVVSGETIRLSQFYGAKFLNCSAEGKNEGRTQGIIGISDAEGQALPLEDVFIRFMENDVMDALPLIDVKAVKPNYRFIRNGDESFQYYACARDGWLAVNNPVDGSYLWIDSRRPGDFPSEPDYPLPYFEHGSFTDTTPWPVACGFGGSDEWFPTPPGNGNPDDCSAPELCTPDSGGGGEQDAGVGGSDAGQPPPPDAGGSPDAGVSPDAGGVPADLVVRRTCLPANPGAGTPASVRVDVINQGLGSAGASTTRTLFADGSSDNHPTPVLAGAGAMHSYTLALPPLCFGCGFTVDADFFNVVGETNEGNNGIASSCSP